MKNQSQIVYNLDRFDMFHISLESAQISLSFSAFKYWEYSLSKNLWFSFLKGQRPIIEIFVFWPQKPSRNLKSINEIQRLYI